MYGHSQREMMIAQAASTASLAVVGRFTPGYFPAVVKACALVFTVAAGAAGILLVKHRPTAGSASGETTVATLNFDGTTGAAGKIVYAEFRKKVLPGEELVYEITDVAASGVVDIKSVVVEQWEVPENNTDMQYTV